MYDFIGIGLGPFNLGLACLTEPVDDLDGLFLEARDELSWHPGMLLDEATLQVPFLADLVTMADPTSRWSFLNYLKQTGHLYPFYIRESFYPLRKEYDDYCRWAAERLGNVRFGQPVVAVQHDGAAYVVRTGTGEEFRARRLVLGVGTAPSVPECFEGMAVAHSADYLAHKERLQSLGSITVVGSGQSAAEIYHDLLVESPAHDYELTWLTRSPRFFPMEYTKLTLELTSPEYTSYFQGLPELTRRRLLRDQRSLYKGISGDLVDAIFDLHYRLRVDGAGPRTTLITNTAVVGATSTGDGYDLELHHEETDELFGLRTEGLVLATGYSARVPAFLDGIRDRIAYDEDGRYEVSPTYAVDRTGEEIFVQNAEEHSHGFVAPDLGMGAYRNSVLVAAMAGREVYPIEKRIAVQSFGVPDHLRAGAMTLEPLQLPRDLGRLHAWVTHPKAVYWEMQDASVQDVAAEYTLIGDDPHHDAWLGRVDGEPAYLAETYDPYHSELAQFPELRPGDLGMHVLVAPTQAPVPGFTRRVFREVMAHCFAEPSVRRVVVEPDIRNERIAMLNKAAGFEVARPVQLRTKEAALSFCTRAAWEESGL